MFSHDEIAQALFLLVPACREPPVPALHHIPYTSQMEVFWGFFSPFPPREVLKKKCTGITSPHALVCSQLTISKGRAGTQSPLQPPRPCSPWVLSLPQPRAPHRRRRALPSIHPPVWVIELGVANHMLWMCLSPLALAPAEVQGDSLEEATFNL